MEANGGHDYEALWAGSGFARNPYDHRPLRVSAEDRELFVGRSKEQELFKIQTAGRGGGIVVVEGPIGVGKTSFVNAMLYDKWNPEKKKIKGSKKSYSYLPSFETIQLKENVELSDFMLSVLSNCIFSLERIHGEQVSSSDRALKAGKELVSNIVRSGIGGFSLSILGTGGGVDRNQTAVKPASIPLPTIMNVMDRWFDGVVKKFGYEAALVPINNLDVLSERNVINFLNSARDTLLSRNHVWWVLIGGPGLFSTLEINARRVSELVTGQPITLEPMSLEEVLEAVKTRIEKFRSGKDAKPPIPQETIKMLYEVSSGEVRYIFKRLSDIIYVFRATFPSERYIPEQIAAKALHILAQRKLDALNLTDRERDVLKRMSLEKNFRIRDYTKFRYNKPQPMQNLVSKFLRLGLLRRVERSIREVYYSTSGDVNLVFR
ncbi:MAG: hypothetical protein ACRDF4_07750 [Rhabdochlamydiaceae bacterium]